METSCGSLLECTTLGQIRAVSPPKMSETPFSREWIFSSHSLEDASIVDNLMSSSETLGPEVRISPNTSENGRNTAWTIYESETFASYYTRRKLLHKLILTFIKKLSRSKIASKLKSPDEHVYQNPNCPGKLNFH